MRAIAVVVLVLLTAAVLGQRASQDSTWLRGGGGGFAYSYQGIHGMELFGQYTWAYDGQAKLLYAVCVELTAGGHFGDRFLHAQSLGVRQSLMYTGVLGLTCKVAVDNYSNYRWPQDPRLAFSIGPTLLGIITIEYSHSLPVDAEPLLTDQNRISIQLGLNSALFQRAFRGIPIS